MNSEIARHRQELEQLCERFHVKRLELFGSAATGHLSDESDLDFLIEFLPGLGTSYPDAYFGLSEALETLFGRRVDLVVDAAIRNPYFRQSADESKVLLYGA